MTLLSATNLAQSYGARMVFRGVSLEPPARARIALVGPNGIGKTSLLRMLAGLEPPKAGQAPARDLLGRFLFSGDAVEQRIETLSGGERARLALAKLVLSGANLPLLDEPTPHLDLPSQEALQSALAAFPGTILLVTHDRYLVEALATQVWLVGDAGARLRVYPGGYFHFQAARAAETAAGGWLELTATWPTRRGETPARGKLAAAGPAQLAAMV